ncbi:hypothetical protein MKK67_02505 [Methylobacterium sp. J-072]|uniref:hypothetical protein n=1 Tax=Methylobacterium sp. J-072 TaxID=2836651 RepID=UPI001FB8CCB8|nr:hypothetical protein [Methylobacterium sp. J-072]MCJ2091385.1 hypothetical protein [Methylobacterium sp. J-072]
MSNAAIEARRLTLIRFEYAAGTAFGCDEETVTVPQSRLLVASATVAIATFATALAATISYLV